jgi:O-6-methylguanine DNA methyltransferase
MTKSAMKNVTPFAEQIYQIVKQIPKGETRTYKEVAEATGRPNAFRAVGNILNKNRDKEVPCHRVVRSDGKSGGYAWGAEKKVRILRKEGAILMD